MGPDGSIHLASLSPSTAGNHPSARLTCTRDSWSINDPRTLFTMEIEKSCFAEEAVAYCVEAFAGARYSEQRDPNSYSFEFVDTTSLTPFFSVR